MTDAFLTSELGVVAEAGCLALIPPSHRSPLHPCERGSYPSLQSVRGEPLLIEERQKQFRLRDSQPALLIPLTGETYRMATRSVFGGGVSSRAKLRSLRILSCSGEAHASHMRKLRDLATHRVCERRVPRKGACLGVHWDGLIRSDRIRLFGAGETRTSVLT